MNLNKVVGGVSAPETNLLELGPDGEQAVEYARENVAGLGTAKLVSFRQQVVAGTLYYFRFEGRAEEVKVWSRPWLNAFAIQQ